MIAKGSAPLPWLLDLPANALGRLIKAVSSVLEEMDDDQDA